MVRIKINKSHVTRCARRVVYIVLGVFVGYLLIASFPQFLFSHKVVYKDFVVYSREDIPDAIYPILDITSSKLGKSDLYIEGMKQRVFIVNSYPLYTFLSYQTKTTFAGYYSLSNNIFIANADIEGDTVYRKMDELTRSLENIITHETVHAILAEELGFWWFTVNFPVWINEGYCDYIAGGSTASEGSEIEYLCSDENIRGYFNYRLAMEYLIDDKSMTIGEILENSPSYEDMRRIIKEKYCIKNDDSSTSARGTREYVNMGSIPTNSY